jgi:hypothetical protein
VKLRRIKYGLHEYIPAIFSDFHFSYVECLLHTRTASFNIVGDVGALKLAYQEKGNFHKVELHGVRNKTQYAKYCCFSDKPPIARMFARRHIQNYANQLLETCVFIDKLLSLSDYNVRELPAAKQLLEEDPAEPQYMVNFQPKSQLPEPTQTHLDNLLISDFFGIGLKTILRSTLHPNPESLSLEAVDLQTPETIIAHLDTLHRLNYSLFPKMVDLSLLLYSSYINEGTLLYHSNVKRMLQQNIVSTTYSVDNIGQAGECCIGEYHNKIADCVRVDINYKSQFAQSLPVENNVLFAGQIPVFFVDKIIKAGRKQIDECGSIYGAIDGLERHQSEPIANGQMHCHFENNWSGNANICVDVETPEIEDLDIEDEVGEEGGGLTMPKNISPMIISRGELEESDIHIVFLVHGYQGSSFDLSTLKNTLLFLCSGAIKVECCVSNNSDTTSCIDQLGINLSNEVREHLSYYKFTNIKK